MKEYVSPVILYVCVKFGVLSWARRVAQMCTESCCKS
jgi:hypothetical protein